MPFCPKCGKEVESSASFCPECGASLNNAVTEEASTVSTTTNNIVRFILTFLLGFIGSIIINYSGLKPKGWKSRTLAYIFLSLITFGIYGFVASICNLLFNPNNDRNIGYYKEK